MRDIGHPVMQAKGYIYRSLPQKAKDLRVIVEHADQSKQESHGGKVSDGSRHFFDVDGGCPVVDWV
jgi:hypothetical protein